DARLFDPDLSPDGTTLVCVQQRPGQRDLVLVHRNGSAFGQTSSVTTLISEPETQFNAPRWSPDGRTIAVERHRPGALSQIVLIDAATKGVRPIAWSGPARMVTPAWRPDGRALVVAVAPQEETFNLYEIGIDDASAPRQITHMSGGATWPDISADGRT